MQAIKAGTVALIAFTLSCARTPAWIPPDNPRSIDAGDSHLSAFVDEAQLALAVMAAPTDRSATDAWDALRKTEAYRRLHEREATLGRAFTDSSFFAFLRAPATQRNAAALGNTLREWSRADLADAVGRAAAYLPPSAPIRASMYFMIKPRLNTFVFDLDRNPAIFVAIDTTLSSSEFLNEIAHELHHVGYNAACANSVRVDSTEPMGTVRKWMSAFGEGWAMLAAAGGPGVHPHAESDQATRDRWDRDYAQTPQQRRQLERFFDDVLNRRVSEDSATAAAMSFFGVQGPWYTVGYLMAQTIEVTFGHPALMRVLCDPVAMIFEYDRAAGRRNSQGAQVPRWSEAFLGQLRRHAPD